MSVDLELTPKTKRPAGERCCEPVVYPDVERDQAVRMAHVAKALGDPVRLQLVDVLRKHAGKVCVCELVIDPIITLGSHVTKGQQLEYFQYGGSTHCLIFRPGVIKDFHRRGDTAADERKRATRAGVLEARNGYVKARVRTCSWAIRAVGRGADRASLGRSLCRHCDRSWARC